MFAAIDGCHMNLFLIRHAEAVPEAATDMSRELTDLGREQACKLAAAFQRLGVRFDAIVASPYVRAQQTSEAMLAGWREPKPPVHTFDEIGFDVRPKKIVKFLKKLGHNSIAIVGHQPGLSRFAGWLIGSKKAQIDLDKAGIIKINCDTLEKGGGALEWLITSEWL